MLKRLTIENYALIDHLEIEFDKELNIITGETGAGKSVLLSALGTVLGAKPDAAIIKDPQKNCWIEAEFEGTDTEIKTLAEENCIDIDDSLIIRRILMPGGKNRAFVNDQPSSISLLRDIASFLIDIHSQHDTLLLTSGAYRLKAIDSIASNEEIRKKYRLAFERVKELRRNLAELKERVAEERKNADWTLYQFKELDEAKLEEGEKERLEEEQQILENAERISEAVVPLAAIMDEENGVLDNIHSILSGIEHLQNIYPNSKNYVQRLRSLEIELKDISGEAHDEIERIQSNPERLEAIDKRLGLIYNLLKKHSKQTVSELISLKEHYKTMCIELDEGEETIAELEKELSKAVEEETAIEKALHKSREDVLEKFSKDVENRLKFMAMNDAVFQASITSKEASLDGCDEITFLFSANRGMAVQPVQKVASGGELSRIMLSLKSVLSSVMKLPTIIFDEIDTGVSGMTAAAVGDVLLGMSKGIQLINITHLPQVASLGRRHFFVYKQNSSTYIKVLSEQERLEEIAKMLSSAEITQAAREQAKNLLDR
ncbi:MAG: DNA repair protein RecN [Alistipes sp.]|nr:DNA repair protein RecN [Candidatus Alistipes equi]